MFRIGPLSIIRSFSLYTQQWYMSYRFADSLRTGTGRNWFGSALRNTLSIFKSWRMNDSRTKLFPSWSWSQAVSKPSKPVWHIPLLCVQWRTPDDGQRTCPKHVEFYSKNKFEKLVDLVGSIIWRYQVNFFGNFPLPTGQRMYLF